MSGHRKLKKPDWPVETGMWLNEYFITDPVRNELRKRLPKKWDEATKGEFMNALSVNVHEVEDCRTKIAAAEHKKALESVETAARALLTALAKITGDTKQLLDASTGYLAGIYGGAPSCPLSRRTMGLWKDETALHGWWDVVQDIELATAYVGGHIRPSKGARTKQDHTRALVSAAARAVQSCTGKLPPGSKGTWFPVFAEFLCECFDVNQCGVDLVAKVLNAMRENSPLAI